MISDQENVNEVPANSELTHFFDHPSRDHPVYKDVTKSLLVTLAHKGCKRFEEHSNPNRSRQDQFKASNQSFKDFKRLIKRLARF